MVDVGEWAYGLVSFDEGKEGREKLTGTLIGARLDTMTLEENMHDNSTFDKPAGKVGEGRDEGPADELFRRMSVELEATSHWGDATYDGGMMALDEGEKALFLSCLTD